MWTMGGCIASAAYLSLYLFIFLSVQFSNIKIFVTLFSGTVWPRRLKLGRHVDSGQMYRVYRNQAAALIHASISSFFFLLNFQTLKFFVTVFSRTLRPKIFKLCSLVDINQLGWCILYTRMGLLPLICPFISSFFFLSNFQSLTIFVTFFSGTMRPRKLKLGTHVVHNRVYRD